MPILSCFADSSMHLSVYFLIKQKDRPRMDGLSVWERYMRTPCGSCSLFKQFSCYRLYLCPVGVVLFLQGLKFAL